MQWDNIIIRALSWVIVTYQNSIFIGLVVQFSLLQLSCVRFHPPPPSPPRPVFQVYSLDLQQRSQGRSSRLSCRRFPSPPASKHQMYAIINITHNLIFLFLIAVKTPIFYFGFLIFKPRRWANCLMRCRCKKVTDTQRRTDLYTINL